MRRCWVNFQCRGVLLNWIVVGQGPTVLAVGVCGGGGGGGIVVGQGPTALAVGAGGWGGVWTFFLSSISSLFFLPLSGRRPDID